MKANELRIGNYILFDNDVYDVRGFVNDRVKIHNREVYIGQLFKPIPLTGKWLLKFGFKLIVNKDVFDDFHYPYFVKNGVILLYNYTSENNICYKGGFAEMRSGKYYAVTPIWIDSVHQLQNLYFVLTGEELKLLKDE